MRPLVYHSRAQEKASALFAALVLLGLIVVFSIGTAISLSHFHRNLSLLEERQIKRWSGQKAQAASRTNELPAAMGQQPTQAADE